MDGGSERDRVPGIAMPEYLECEHCGCEAVVGDAPIGAELDCITCSHPGKVELDSTNQPAWFLRKGTCLDPKCGNCNPLAPANVARLADDAKAQFHLIDESLWAVPDAQMLVSLARKVSDGTGLPAVIALQAIAADLEHDLTTAQRTLGSVVDLARKQLTAHVVTHEVLQ